MTETSPRVRRPRATPPSAWNIANALTVTRLVLVIPFAWLLLYDDGGSPSARVGAGLVFLLASFTDFVDGDLARRRDLITTFGKIADPVADKALTGTALVCLSVLGELPWWVTIVILAREIGVTLMRLWVIRDGVIAASRGGKVKTALQLFAILLYLLPLDGAAADARAMVMGLAVIATLVTGADYVRQVVRVRRAARAGAND
jgi:CDP-diacylglycerol---glycerol-3-phosphate 3-phosphatidyltransferase